MYTVGEINVKSRFRKIGGIILAALVGEIALILLTTVAQEVMFDGIDYFASSLSDIFFGGLATFLAAVLAGMAASLVVGGRTVAPHIVISIIIIIETTSLILTGVLSGPVWFDILGGLSLILGVWAGHYAAQAFLFNR